MLGGARSVAAWDHLTVLRDWNNFAVMIGGAAGALTGLLFVGVSLNRDAILRHARLRATAAQTLVQFVVPLVLAIVLLVPEQAHVALGIELILVSVVTAAVLLHLGRRKKVEHVDNRLTVFLTHRSANVVGPLFCLAAGVSWLAGGGGELYWLVPTVLVALLQGVLTAWLFLVAQPR